MEIQLQKVGAVTVVEPRGPVTADHAEQLKTSLLDSRQKSLGRIVLDLARVPFVDSCVLEALLDVTEDLEQVGQTLKLSNTNDVLREVLELTGIVSHFELYEDVNSAVRSFL